MKESVLDVLLYLFEHYFEGEGALGSDQESVKSELTQAGFAEAAVDKALTWLEGLTGVDGLALTPAGGAGSLRLFGGDELDRLDVRVRGYLMSLEQAGVLDPVQREFVIDRVMALETDEVDLEQVRWVARMVLFHRPGREWAGRWLEGLVLDQGAGLLH
jgi:Smg protein